MLLYIYLINLQKYIKIWLNSVSSSLDNGEPISIQIC